MSLSLEIPYFEKILVGSCVGGKNFLEKSLRPIQGRADRPDNDGAGRPCTSHSELFMTIMHLLEKSDIV